MPRSKSDTIEAMGLENFINTKFAYLEAEFGMKPYQKYIESLHLPDTMIADLFSTPERIIKAQTVGNWRRAHAKGLTRRGSNGAT